MNRNNKNAVNNTGVKKKYRWINDIEPVFMEDSKRNYGHRTWANAEWSDITLALAVDMDSPGEITTRKAAGDKYVGFYDSDGPVGKVSVQPCRSDNQTDKKASEVQDGRAETQHCRQQSDHP